VRQLNLNVADLVVVGQKRVSPVQSWCNKRERKAVKERLEAKYFQQPVIGQTPANE
jgi:hypothetical protein